MRRFATAAVVGVAAALTGALSLRGAAATAAASPRRTTPVAAAAAAAAVAAVAVASVDVASAAASEVSLSTAAYDLVSGAFSGTISVENIAYVKTVTVFYSSPAGSWSTSNAVDAAYSAASSTSGYEYWTFSTTTATAGAALSPGSQYYIAYTVNGSTYYDNNSAANYLVAGSWSYTPYASAPTDSAQIRLNSVTLSENGTTVLSGVLWIDNIAYVKTVQACYSASGSSASTCVAAAYQAAASGVYETWTFSATDSTIAVGSSVSFSYTVSGSTYSDGPYVLGTDSLPSTTAATTSSSATATTTTAAAAAATTTAATSSTLLSYTPHPEGPADDVPALVKDYTFDTSSSTLSGTLWVRADDAAVSSAFSVGVFYSDADGIFASSSPSLNASLSASTSDYAGYNVWSFSSVVSGGGVGMH
ncbi:hypothetical protein HK405_012302, partial [Cladochytrium tenue]